MADFPFRSLKDGFFDSEKVMKRVSAAKRKALSRCGAFVWKRDKSSLRYGTGRSSPGSPPIVHRSPAFSRRKRNRKTGVTTKQPASPLRELTYFAYDERAESVVVGPEVFRNSKIGGGRAPRAIELGGESVKMTPRGPKSIQVAARPHTYPALVAEAPNFPETFRSTVTE